MAGDESGYPCGEGQCSFRQLSGRAAFDAGRSEGGCWGMLSGARVENPQRSTCHNICYRW